MVVLDSPFAALQLVGLMLPVVVLTLKAHVRPLRDERESRHEQIMGLSPNQRKIRRASTVAIVSLLSFIASAFVALAGPYLSHSLGATTIVGLWGGTVGLGFLAYAAVVGLWLYELIRPEKIDMV